MKNRRLFGGLIILCGLAIGIPFLTGGIDQTWGQVLAGAGTACLLLLVGGVSGYNSGTIAIAGIAPLGVGAFFASVGWFTGLPGGTLSLLLGAGLFLLGAAMLLGGAVSLFKKR